MKRLSILQPKAVVSVSVVGAVNGGTGVSSASAALTLMNAVPASSIGLPGGPIPLDEQGMLPIEAFDTNTFTSNKLKLTGPTQLTAGETGTYTISNYDSYTTYTLSATSGTVNRNADTITYTAPSTPGVAGFTINDRSVQIAVGAAAVSTPSIVSPVNLSTDHSSSLSFVSSSFSTLGANDIHDYSDWQLSLNSSFTNVVASSMSSTVNKTTYTATNLQPNTTYYIRIRHHASVLGYSQWSATLQFSTKTVFIPTNEVAVLTPAQAIGVYNYSRQSGKVIAVSKNGLRAAVSWTDANSNGQANIGGISIFNKSAGVWVREKTYAENQGGTMEAMRKGGHCMCFSADGNSLFFGETASDVNNFPRIRQAKFENGAWSANPAIIIPAVNLQTTTVGVEFRLTCNDAGTLLIVGDHGSGNVGGKITFYTYDGSNWQSPSNYVNNPGITYNDQGGWALSLSGNGDYLAVAYPQNSPHGKVIVLKKEAGVSYHSTASTNITPTSDLMTDSLPQSVQFGWSVAMNYAGDIMVVGAPDKDENSRYNDGAIYVYARSGTTWSLLQKIANDTAPHNSVAGPSDTGKRFGESVAISTDGSTIYASALNYNTGVGTVFVYVKSGSNYVYNSMIQPDNVTGLTRFGWKVAYNDLNGELFASSIDADSSNGKVWVFN